MVWKTNENRNSCYAMNISTMINLFTHLEMEAKCKVMSTLVLAFVSPLEKITLNFGDIVHESGPYSEWGTRNVHEVSIHCHLPAQLFVLSSPL